MCIAATAAASAPEARRSSQGADLVIDPSASLGGLARSTRHRASVRLRSGLGGLAPRRGGRPAPSDRSTPRPPSVPRGSRRPSTPGGDPARRGPSRPEGAADRPRRGAPPQARSGRATSGRRAGSPAVAGLQPRCPRCARISPASGTSRATSSAGVGPFRVEVRQVKQPPSSADRVGVVVHPEVDPAVVAAAVPAALPDHEERRRLAAAPVAPGGIGRGKTGHQQLRERETSGLERVRQPVDHRGPREDVALGRVVAAGSPARPGEAGASRVVGRPPLRVHDTGLALCARPSASTSAASAPCASAPLSRSARPSGPYRTLAYDWVAIAPTPARAHGTTDPTARNLDWTATPRSPVTPSRATMEYVTTSASSRCIQRVAGSKPLAVATCRGPQHVIQSSARPHGEHVGRPLGREATASEVCPGPRLRRVGHALPHADGPRYRSQGATPGRCAAA